MNTATRANLRTTTAARPTAEYDATRYAAYDEIDRCSDFVRFEGADRARANLAVGGVTCAACTWLIERSLSELAGVQDAQVSLADGVLWTGNDDRQHPDRNVHALRRGTARAVRTHLGDVA